MPYKIKVLRDVCIGAGTCVAEAPNTFELDEDDIAIILSTDEDDDEEIMAAAEGCPVDAIILIDTDSGEQVWPED